MQIKICHDTPTAGHYGIKKTISLTFRDFWWPFLSSNIKKFVQSIDIYCLSKTTRYKPYSFLNSLEIGERPCSSILIHFITYLPDFDGFICILLINDRLTKMFHLIPFHGSLSLLTLLLSSLTIYLKLPSLRNYFW